MNHLYTHVGPTVCEECQCAEKSIFVRLSIDESACFPANNHLATTIAAHHLKLFAEMGGVYVLRFGGAFEFNRSLFFLSIASPLPAALDAIKRCLMEMNVLGNAQIAWWDPKEGICREWFPRQGRPFPALAEIERMLELDKRRILGEMNAPLPKPTSASILAQEQPLLSTTRSSETYRQRKLQWVSGVLQRVLLRLSQSMCRLTKLSAGLRQRDGTPAVGIRSVDPHVPQAGRSRIQ
jgi:hypothetical protein